MPQHNIIWSKQQLLDGLGRSGSGDGAMAGDATMAGDAVDGASGFAIDSREMKEGMIFLPLVGDKQDGHDYIEDVIKNGAAGSLCQREYIKNYSAEVQKKLIASDDVMADIKKLATHRRGDIKKNGGKVLAITGSVGKTSVKEMVGHLLQGLKIKNYKSPLNQNNTLGVPLSLLNSPADIEAGVYEAGMNHKGELAEIAATLMPDIVVINNIRESHIGHLGSLEAIADAKAELFCPTTQMAIVEKPADPQYDFSTKLQKLFLQANPAGRMVMIGQGGDIEWTAMESHPNPSGAKPIGHAPSNSHQESIQSIDPIQNFGQLVKANFFQQPIEYQLPMTGAHHGFNSLAALAILSYLLGWQEDGQDSKQDSEQGDRQEDGQDGILIKQQLPKLQILFLSYQSMAGRGATYQLQNQNTHGEKIMVIDESYNAAPASMAATLLALNDYFSPWLGATKENIKKIAILGDMKELGKDEIRYHQEVIADALAQQSITAIILVGGTMKKSYGGGDKKIIAVVDNATQAIATLDGIIVGGMVVMVKASHAMGLEKIVKHLQGKG